MKQSREREREREVDCTKHLAEIHDTAVIKKQLWTTVILATHWQFTVAKNIKRPMIMTVEGWITPGW